MQKKIGILYIETGQLGGGSFESLLQIVSNLDRLRFSPVVVFFTENRIRQSLTDLEIPHYLLYDTLLTKDPNKYLLTILGRITSFIFTFLPRLSVLCEKIVHYRTLRNLDLIVKKHDIQILHLNNQITRHFFGTITARRNKIPCISHLRSPNVGRFNSVKADYANKTVYQYLAILGDTVDVWKEKGVDPSKMIVMYNCITPFTAEKLDLHEKYKISKSKNYIIGCIGRIIPERGYDFMIKSFALISKVLPNAILLIIGYGEKEDRDELIKLAKSLGIEESVLFFGFEKQAKEVVASLDVLVVSYTICPLGRILLESWQLKTPVIATDIYPIRKVIQDGVDALLVEYGNTKQMQEVVYRLATEDGLRDTLTDNAYIKCNANFTMARYIENLQNLYDEALKSHT